MTTFTFIGQPTCEWYDIDGWSVNVTEYKHWAEQEEGGSFCFTDHIVSVIGRGNRKTIGVYVYFPVEIRTNEYEYYLNCITNFKKKEAKDLIDGELECTIYVDYRKWLFCNISKEPCIQYVKDICDKNKVIREWVEKRIK